MLHVSKHMITYISISHGSKANTAHKRHNRTQNCKHHFCQDCYNILLHKAFFLQLILHRPFSLNEFIRLGRPKELALLDIVELAQRHDSIIYVKWDILIFICRDFGFDQMSQATLPILKVATILQDEYVFQETFKHVVGRRLASKRNLEGIHPIVGLLVKKHIDMTYTKVTKIYHQLLALEPDDPISETRLL